ncbi:DUF6325 family protein [Leucobacter sp.]
MTHFRYGPVELHLVGFTGDAPSPEVLGALEDLLETGLVRLLDFVLVSKSEDGVIDIVEIEAAGSPGLSGAAPLASGLVGAEDVESLSEAIAPGSSAALVALELAYQRELAEKLAASGGEVLRSERIPAPIVNAVLDLAEQEEGD